MVKRILTPTEQRCLTAEQQEYLNDHPHIFSLQPYSMLSPGEQLYKTWRHGAVTIDRAMELDVLYDQQLAQQSTPLVSAIAHGDYSDA